MKAAILVKESDALELITGFPEPVPANDNEVLLVMEAAAIKHLDRSKAGGKHYSAGNSDDGLKVIGGDGVGILPDGTRVFALGVTGMAAEKAVAEKNRMIPVPDGLDSVTAAALPNAVAGSAMALRYRAKIEEGDTVLINGATGFTGKIAVQIARIYGAKKIIATGRNENILQSLKALGADEVISLRQDDSQLLQQFSRIHQVSPVNIIVDYLWGRSAELLLTAIKGDGGFTPKTRFISVGSMGGDTIQLSSEILRSADLQLSGSGLGSWNQMEMRSLLREIIPAMFQLAVAGKLKADTVTVKLEDLGMITKMELKNGERIVIKM